MEADHPFAEISDARMRAYLVAYAEMGVKHRAAAAAGISDNLIYTRRWREDEAFQKAQERAYVMAADRLEAAARERAVKGVRQYRFTKDGDAIRHPTRCECGHDKGLHVLAPRKGEQPDPEDGTYARHQQYRAACAHPDCEDCEAFVGEAYYEHVYSDNLLKFLLTGALPRRHAKRMEIRGAIASLDVSKLPDALVARIAAGEHPMQVLATASQDDRARLLPSGVEVGGPGAGTESRDSGPEPSSSSGPVEL